MRSAASIANQVAVVTGGAGFIGSHLCDALLDTGNDVVCVDNLVGGDGSDRNIAHLAGNARFSFVHEDVVDWASDADLAGVDVVFHQAASKNTVSLSDPDRDLMVNGMGTLRLLLAAQRAGVKKFVHGSTGSVFGQLQARQDENHPKNPVSFYGVSKLAGESYCRVVSEIYGLNCTVYRYYHVIGPRQDDSEVGGVVPIFARRCQEGQPLTIYGTGEQVRSFTSVFDVVQANILAAADPERSRGFFNCASGIRVTIQELAEFILEETGTAKGIEYADWRPGDILEFDIDNSQITELGMHFNQDWKSVVRQVIAEKVGRDGK
jgi:UDP-glucose 4-epimerase